MDKSELPHVVGCNADERHGPQDIGKRRSLRKQMQIDAVRCDAKHTNLVASQD